MARCHICDNILERVYFEDLGEGLKIKPCTHCLDVINGKDPDEEGGDFLLWGHLSETDISLLPKENEEDIEDDATI